MISPPDACTNADMKDNGVVVLTPTRYCFCVRLPDNTKSYINFCEDCSNGLTYDPAVETCSLKLTFQCIAGKHYLL